MDTATQYPYDPHDTGRRCLSSVWELFVTTCELMNRLEGHYQRLEQVKQELREVGLDRPYSEWRRKLDAINDVDHKIIDDLFQWRDEYLK